MKHVWKPLCMVAMTLILLTAVGGAALAASTEEAPVSPALSIISKDLALVKSGLCGREISFAASDFEEALGIASLDYITVRTVPSAAMGKLMLGSLQVMPNQTVSAANLSALRFVPNGSVEGRAEFLFCGDDSCSYEVACTLYMQSELNYAPTFVGIDKEEFSVETYKNIAVYGTLPAEDPEWDKLRYEITSTASKGLLVMLDREQGRFVYTPMKNYTGTDRFTYTVTDEYGNRSEEKEMKITVGRSKKSTVFSDMIGNEGHLGAIRLYEAGIMDAKEEGASAVFHPTGEVSRVEFLVMAMKAEGITPDGDGNLSGVFADEKEIPKEYRPYVKTAYEKGYLAVGVKEGEAVALKPNEALSRAEACVILCSILEAEATVSRPAFEDDGEIPSWAKEAIYTLEDRGILLDGDSFAYPNRTLTREMTAVMLNALL